MMLSEKDIFNYNFENTNLPSTLPKQVHIWDETLREGEQTPGVFFKIEEKVKIAKLLDELGVKIICAGFPVVSMKEKEAVKKIVSENLNARVSAVARTLKNDIDTCLTLDVPEINIFAPVSNLHIKLKIGITKEENLERIISSVEYAKAQGLCVNFVAEDSSRADISYVVKVFNEIEPLVDKFVLTDTVGIMRPLSIKFFLSYFRKDKLGIHCHNDFGLALANTLAAIECGVKYPHVTVNGIGERAGNTALDELVLSLKYLYNLDTGIKLPKLYSLSKMVEEYSGIPIGVHKPFVGYNAFSHESGVHTRGMLKDPRTYEPIPPSEIGRKSRFLLGKHAGKYSIISMLKTRDVKVNTENVLRILNSVKSHAESKSKKYQREYIEYVRKKESLRMGLAEEEFWDIVKKFQETSRTE
jgi:isopropylmalate/homocitrate/citramalate synthase